MEQWGGFGPICLSSGFYFAHTHSAMNAPVWGGGAGRASFVVVYKWNII